MTRSVAPTRTGDGSVGPAPGARHSAPEKQRAVPAMRERPGRTVDLEGRLSNPASAFTPLLAAWRSLPWDTATPVRHGHRAIGSEPRIGWVRTASPTRTGRASRWWRVPAGTHPWVALAVTTPVPGTVRVGHAATTPSHTDGPDGSQNEGILMDHEQFVPRRALRSGDRGGRGTQVHLRPETGAVMLWPSASAVGWLLMMTALIVLARSGTARWEREQERGAGTGGTRPCAQPTTGPAPSRGSSGR
jgi:hypothetical protein